MVIDAVNLLLITVQLSITVMEKEYLVFVYGTLKKNEPNHEKYLSTSKFVTAACTIEKFPLVIASKYNIPFAIDHAGSGKVCFFLNSTYCSVAIVFGNSYLTNLTSYHVCFQKIKGEIYMVNECSLAALDELENHPVLYERQLLEFEVENAPNQKAWIYLLKKFKPEMLHLPCYDSYSSEGSHGKRYVPRYEREKPLSYDSIQ